MRNGIHIINVVAVTQHPSYKPVYLEVPSLVPSPQWTFTFLGGVGKGDLEVERSLEFGNSLKFL